MSNQIDDLMTDKPPKMGAGAFSGPEMRERDYEVTPLAPQMQTNERNVRARVEQLEMEVAGLHKRMIDLERSLAQFLTLLKERVERLERTIG